MGKNKAKEMRKRSTVIMGMDNVGFGEDWVGEPNEDPEGTATADNHKDTAFVIGEPMVGKWRSGKHTSTGGKEVLGPRAGHDGIGRTQA